MDSILARGVLAFVCAKRWLYALEVNVVESVVGVTRAYQCGVRAD